MELPWDDKKANACRAMLDLAVRQGGLQVAEVCAVLERDISTAIARASLPPGRPSEAAPPVD